jgi:hypothetical protein
VRLPLLPLSAAHHDSVRRVLDRLNLSASVQPRHSSAA